MRNLIQILLRYSNFLIFLILEVVAFILICTSNEYQRSAVWSSANRMVAGVNNIQTTIGDYFHLRAQNEQLAVENAQLKSALMLLENQFESAVERDSQYIYSQLDWEYIPAKVIGTSTNKQHNYLTINKIPTPKTLSILLFSCTLHSIVVILQKFLKQQYYEETFYSCIVRTRYVQCTRIRNGSRNYLNRVVFYYAI